MLSVQTKFLSEAESLQISKWLLQPEASLLKRCLLAEIAALQAEAANVVVRNPESLSSQAGLDNRAATALTQASRFQTCLNVLNDALSEKLKLRTAEVQITDQHDH
jgi:hypothetical protein